MDELRWLLIDSCGPLATMAVGHGKTVLASEAVVGRSFSAEWPAVLRRLMDSVAKIEVIGVVHGPGSFTGVRVGLAAAKGLCEGTGARMVAISRLEALQTVGGGAIAVLDAGRGEVYLRDDEGERICAADELRERLRASEAVTGDATLAAEFGARLIQLHADAALPVLLERVREQAFDDVNAIDANYVRGEREIYRKLQVSGIGQ